MRSSRLHFLEQTLLYSGTASSHPSKAPSCGPEPSDSLNFPVKLFDFFEFPDSKSEAMQTASAAASDLQAASPIPPVTLPRQLDRGSGNAVRIS